MAATAPFAIEVAVPRLREATRDLPPAVMFGLYDDGFRSLFQQLIACIVSIRTREEVTEPAARRLFAVASGPAEVLALSPAALTELIKPCAFAENKAVQIHEIARRTVEQHAGTLPCDYDALVALPGVGPKCANLSLGVACHRPLVAVDIHVHRVANRWGYIKTSTPEQSSEVLNRIVPEAYRIELNRLLVPFGRTICTGRLPLCSTCPLQDMCARVGVAAHR